MTLFKVNSGASLKVTNAMFNVPHIVPPPPPPDFYILSSSYDTETIFTGSGQANARFGTSAKALAADEGIYCLFGEPAYDGSEGSDEGRVFLYLSNSSGVTSEIFSPTDISASDQFGAAVDMVSASNGLYIAISSPGKVVGADSSRGHVYLYLKDSGGTNLVSTQAGLLQLSEFGSNTTQTTYEGIMGTSLALGGNNNLFMSCFDYRYPSSFNGAIRLFESASGGVTELDTITAGASGEGWGRSNSMISASDGLYLAVGTDGLYDTPVSNCGRGSLVRWQSSGSYTLDDLQPDQILSGSDAFGMCNPNLLSGSDGINVMMGGQATDFGTSPLGVGRAYLFLSNSSGLTQKSAFTSSDNSTNTQRFGYWLDIISGSDQPLMTFVTSRQDAPGTSDNPGMISIYQTSSNISTFDYLTSSQHGGSINDEDFTRVSAVRSGNSIYIVGAAWKYDSPNTNSGRGYLYKWDLVVSGS